VGVTRCHVPGVVLVGPPKARGYLSQLVVAAGPGGGPRIRTFDGKTGKQMPGPLGNFFSYDPSFIGGVNVVIGVSLFSLFKLEQ
jgi:hypothetical protein